MKYCITKATGSDLRQIQRFFYEIATEFSAKNFLNQDIRRYLKLVADRKFWAVKFVDDHVFTAKLNSEILGVAILLKDGTIPLLLVHPHYRKRSIATQLYTVLESTAVHNHLLVIRVPIEMAMSAFFKKIGFEIVSTIKKVAGGDELTTLHAVKYLKNYSKN